MEVIWRRPIVASFPYFEEAESELPMVRTHYNNACQRNKV
jgi:hypothetical protein